MQIKKYYIIRIFKLRKLRYQEAKLNLILMNIIKKILYNIFLKYSNLFKKHQISPKSLIFKNYKKYHSVNKTKWDEISQKIFESSIILDYKNRNNNFILKNDFLRNHIVSYALHPNQPRLGKDLINYLRNNDYGNQLLSCYSDSAFGKPYLLFPELPTHSSLTLQHFSYLLLINKYLKVDLLTKENSLFIDYGHGYGNMSRILLLLNNKINIHILDLETMLIIQKSFHKNTINSSLLDRIEYFKSDDYESKILKKYYHKHFNATFSLSETNIQNRKKWTIFIDDNIDSFFIAYQEEFDQIKNLGWVKNTIDKLSKKFNIIEGKLPAYNKNRWFGGIRK